MGTYFSLIVPCYNEEEVITTAYNQIKKDLEAINNYELIFVDDGSKDNTWQILISFAEKDKTVKLISLSRNFGQEAALRAGLENASGEYIGFIDADLQDPPHMLPDMIKKLIDEKADVCYGQSLDRQGESTFKLTTAKLYYNFFNYISDIQSPKNANNFRVITRRVANCILSMKEQNQSLRSLVTFVGFKQLPMEFERPPRAAGQTKYTLKKMISLAEDGILAFSNKLPRLPLFLSVFTGFLTLFSVVLSIFNIYITSNINAIMNGMYATLILFSLGILGMYINKVYANTKNRPIYIIDEKINFEEEDSVER